MTIVDNMRNSKATTKLSLAAVAVLLLGALPMSTQVFEMVDADEIVIIQSPIRGTLATHITPGLKLRLFGKTTAYPKRNFYDFQQDIRFNEGGEGTMHGSLQWEMPLDRQNLLDLHTRFGSAEAIQTSLVEVVTDKSVYMTGPLLSSTESYAEKRTNLIYWVEDQINNGTYQTRTEDVQEIDELTGELRIVALVEIMSDGSGQPLRQERGQLTEFGIRPFNFAVTEIAYSPKVEEQIQQQQENIMAVQTAIAQSREAEQRALTVEQQGLANAARARWEQEVLKAQAVTEAEQALQVAQLDRQTADEERQANILRGQGEAERRRLVMEADGALQPKLDAYVEVQKAFADAIASYQGAWVPSVVMGEEASGTAGGGALQLIELLGIRAAQDLAVDLTNRPGGSN